LNVGIEENILRRSNGCDSATGPPLADDIET